MTTTQSPAPAPVPWPRTAESSDHGRIPPAPPEPASESPVEPGNVIVEPLAEVGSGVEPDSAVHADEPPADESSLDDPLGDELPADEPPSDGPGLLRLDLQREIARLLASGKSVAINADGTIAAVDETPLVAKRSARTDVARAEAADAARGKASRSAKIRGEIDREGSRQDPQIVSDVPAGYRSIAWLRPHEAEAALAAYATRRDVPILHDGKAAGWARFYGDSTDEARTYRANVVIHRAGANGARVVCWAKQAEAQATVEAARLHRDVPTLRPDGSPQGLVQYFVPESDEAKRYRSVTRILRVRRGWRTAEDQ
jgi:hypothetical protein